MAGLAGELQRWSADLTGREPEITEEVVAICRHEWAYSSRWAEKRMGYRITPFRRARGKTVEHLKRGSGP